MAKFALTPKLKLDYNKKLLDFCLEKNIPIVRKFTAICIFSYLIKFKYKSFLEIGSAYGYSASLWAQSPYIKSIISLEKNIENYNICLEYNNFKKIKFINTCCFIYKPKKKYDVIFIDGPKSNQINLINYYLKYLKKNGLMFIDNLFLKKISSKPINELNSNQLNMLNKINELNNYLVSQDNFNFQLINIDDGLGLIWKK